MPDRMIRAQCRTSPTLDALSDGAERLHHRLVTVADDYGRFEADPRIVLGACFPLKVQQLKLATIQQWLKELGRVAPGDDAPLITFYTVRGRLYGQYTKWSAHQRDRSKDKNPPRPKYPGPEEGEIVNPWTSRATRGKSPQLAVEPEGAEGQTPAPRATRGKSPQVAASRGKSPPVAASSEIEIEIENEIVIDHRPPAPQVAAEGEARFEEFKKAYPDRNGKKLLMAKAKSLFLALKPDEQTQCIQAAKTYARYCRESNRLPKDAPRFLKGQDGELWREFVSPPQAVPGRSPSPANPNTPIRGEPPPPDVRETLKRLLPSMANALEETP